MKEAVCPVCMNEVAIPQGWESGQQIQCPYCYVEFEPGKN